MMSYGTQFDKRATNLCKGVAICLMVYFHSFGATDPTTFRTVIPVLYNIVAPYGNVCVTFFVLLTGYGFGVKHLNSHETYPRKILPRLIRLYQSYWAVFLLAFLLAPVLSRGTHDWFASYGSVSIPFAEHILLDFFGLSHLAFGGTGNTLNQTWWYMTLAVILILVLPLLCSLWRKCRWCGLVLVVCLCVVVQDVRYVDYLSAAMLGICLAGSNGFVKLHRWGRGAVGLLIRCLLLFGVLFAWYRMRQHLFYIVQADTLAAWAVSQFAFDVIGRIPGLNQGLTWLGKHSGNIFYIHSFVCAYWTQVALWVYSLHYDLLIWAVVLAISCLLSVLVELAKKKTSYNRFFRTLETRWMSRLPEYSI